MVSERIFESNVLGKIIKKLEFVQQNQMTQKINFEFIFPLTIIDVSIKL